MRSVFTLIIFVAVAGFLLAAANGNSAPADTADDALELLFYSSNTPAEFIVVEKKLQKLSLFEHQDQVRLIKEFVCATGQNPGTKKISGDSRTPEGIYFITEIYEDKRITVFGSRAFHLDYPNIFDTHAGHLGDGIFIHGTNKKLIPFSTNGCITLDNYDLDQLAPYLRVNSIPVIVVEALPEPLAGQSLLLEVDTPSFSEILASLSFDLKKIPVQDIQALSFLKKGGKAVASIKYAIYERDHIQYRESVRTYLTQSPVGTWRNIFTVQSQEKDPFLLALRPSKNELVTRLAPAPPPENGVPPEPPAEPAEQVLPEKPIRLAANPTAGKIKATPAVQPEEPVRPAKTPEPGKSAQLASRPATTPPAESDPQPNRGEEVFNFVEKWRTAWAAKDIETYIGCYSPTFKNGTLDREGWKRKKLALNRKYSYINVSIKDIVVQWTPTGATVSFLQTYKSDQYQSTGTKVLQMSNNNNRWLIESEIM